MGVAGGRLPWEPTTGRAGLATLGVAEVAGAKAGADEADADAEATDDALGVADRIGGTD